MKISSKFVLTVQKVILALTLVFFLLILCGTVFNGSNNLFSNLYSPAFTGILLILLSITICLLVLFFNHLIDGLDKKKLIIAALIGFAWMAAVFILVFCNFRSAPYTDSLYVQDTALYFAETGIHEITEDSGHYAYYMRFGNNNLLTILLSYFYRILLKFGISDVITPTGILCASGILAAALFAYLSCVRIGGQKRGVKFLFLCAMNPLFYFLPLWAYSVVLSIPFMMAVLYFGICAYQAKNLKTRLFFCALLFGTAAFGYYIRPTVLIPLIAIACCAVLLLIKGGRKFLRKFSFGILIGGLSFALVFAGADTLNQSYFSGVLADNFPVTHWLMMGSHGEGGHDEEDVEFTKSFETKKEKEKATIEKTVENYKSYTPWQLMIFMGKKIFLTWGQGDGGDLLSKIRQDTRQTSLNSWVLGERNDLLRLYCYAYWLAAFFLAFLSLIRMLSGRKIPMASFLAALTVFGGILFYLFWEAKANYSLPFVYIVLFLSLDGAAFAKEKTADLKERIPFRKIFRAFYGVALLGILGVFVFSFVTMTGTKITLADRSVIYSSPVVSTKAISYKKKLSLSQEFYASKPFDTLELAAKDDLDETKDYDSYRIWLENADGIVLYEGEIHAQDASDNRFTLTLGEIVPDGKEKFVIKIQSEGKEKGKIKFLERRNYYVDLYEGSLVVNDKERRNDLWLKVYENCQAPFCPAGIALLIFGLWYAALLSLSAWFFWGKWRQKKPGGKDSKLGTDF